MQNSQDYGLVSINAKPFRDKAIRHVSSLIERLENHPRKEFLQRLQSITNEISILEQKISEDAKSIDEVILLLEYIDVIKRPENKVDEISTGIYLLRKRMEFIDQIQIMLKSEDYLRFLNLLIWP